VVAWIGSHAGGSVASPNWHCTSAKPPPSRTTLGFGNNWGRRSDHRDLRDDFTHAIDNDPNRHREMLQPGTSYDSSLPDAQAVLSGAGQRVCNATPMSSTSLRCRATGVPDLADAALVQG
jgi:hypothetical protein